MTRWLDPKEYWAGTITGTAGNLFSFADSGFATSIPQGAHSFKGILSAAPIRVRLDATAPTASEGEPLGAGDEILLDEALIEKARLIRSTGVSAKLKGHFYANEAAYFTGSG
jgi:hypothetical protein